MPDFRFFDVFGCFCPSFVGRLHISPVVAFCGFGVYFIGFRSFRAVAGLLCVCSVVLAVFGRSGCGSVLFIGSDAFGISCGPSWLRISSAMGFYFVSRVLLCLWSFRRSVVVSCIRFDLWRLLGVVCPSEFLQLLPLWGVVSLRRSGCFWV